MSAAKQTISLSLVVLIAYVVVLINCICPVDLVIHLVVFIACPVVFVYWDTAIQILYLVLLIACLVVLIICPVVLVICFVILTI